MPKKKLITFVLCKIQIDNSFELTDKVYKARSSLCAAKTAYRADKKLKDIFVLNTENREIHQFNSESFFTVKKEHKLKYNL
tara:strand:- start:248 stop:490 length:243 start_codon:yes stop_codon:yes gene_type:complete